RRLENKYNAKQFALKHSCKVAKLYWHGDEKEFSQFDLKSLPDKYTIKPIFGDSTKDVFLIDNGYNFFNSKFYNVKELEEKILELYKSRPGTELIIEEFLPNEKGEFVVPNDYRFYTFNGE